jgi:hypothetical protein
VSGPGSPTPGQSGDPFTPGNFPEPWTDFDVFGRVVRIPVAGPPPFNTLATFNVLVGGIESTGSDLHQATIVAPTPLVINRFDPGPREHREMRYSCTGTLRRMAMEDDGDFVAAVDEVGRRDPAGVTPLEIHGADFDRNGNWLVRVSIGETSEEVLRFYVVLNCWVLFHESEPPPPETPEEHRVRAQASFAANRLDAYRRYIARPGADLWQAVQELLVLDRQLAAAGYPGPALDAQQLTVTALLSYTPDRARQHEYPILLAEQRHNLIVRLLDNGDAVAAAALGPATLASYNDYLSLADPDRWRVAHDLAALPRFLINAGAPAQALEVQRACVQVLRAYTPPADNRLEYTIFFAEQRHNLIARLIDNGAKDEAVALFRETLDGYRDYVAQGDADRWRAGHDLAELASWMDQATHPHEALDAQQLCVQALAAFVPTGDVAREYAIYLAEQRSSLIDRLIGDDHRDEAAALVADTLAGYRDYLARPGVDAERLRRDLRSLADHLAGAALTGEAALVGQLLIDASLA